MTKKEIADLKKASQAVADMDKDIQTNAALFVGQSLTDNVTEIINPKTGRKQKIAPTPWYKLFIKGVMEDALTDPNGRCGQMLASTLFTQDILDRLGAQAQKTKKDEIDFAVYQIRQTLYKEQQEVFDNDVDQKIIVICSRRAGKTELNARKLMKACLTPNTPCLYLNKTFANAINQLFDLVIEVAGRLEMPIKRSSKNEGEIEFTNGSTIKFGGVNDIAAIDKYRGYAYKLVIVDEVGHIKNGQYLIDEVLTPATADFAGSQMMFTGTPPRVKNYATRLWNSKIRKYHWTAEVNPFIPDFRAFINKVCEEKGLTVDDPFIQREYFGNMNAYDSDAIVFKGWKTYHDLPKLLNGETMIDGRAFHPTWAYIGVDWGGTDNNAIVSIAVDVVDKRALVYDVWTDRMVGTEVIKATLHNKYKIAQELLRRYGIQDNRIKIVTDTNQVELCVDLHKEGLPVEKAIKYDMMNSVEELSAELRTGRCLIPDQWNEDDNYLIKDLNSTVYVRDEETDALKAEIDDAAYHPDAAHALRYALRNWVSLSSWGKGAANTEPLDTTVMPGAENLKQYGTMNMQNAGPTEEFII